VSDLACIKTANFLAQKQMILGVPQSASQQINQNFPEDRVVLILGASVGYALQYGSTKPIRETKPYRCAIFCAM
jgi:hypothetical protein